MLPSMLKNNGHLFEVWDSTELLFLGGHMGLNPQEQWRTGEARVAWLYEEFLILAKIKKNNSCKAHHCNKILSISTYA